jgi:integrase
MPRRANGLTVAKVKTARPGRYGDGRGLYLLVRSPTARFFLFRYRRDGRMREMGLGSAVDVSLAEAGERAIDLYRVVKAGSDPLAEREALSLAEKAAKQQAAVSAVTFSDVANQYIAAHQAGWRNPKHRQQWKNTLDTHAKPIIGGVPVADVDTGSVMLVLEPIWRTRPETASRLRGRIEAILDYARARGWRSAENPARWRGHLDNLLPARGKVAAIKHHPALPWREIGQFMTKLRRQEGVAALALQFTVLTAARTSEVTGATWGEIDIDNTLWTVPASRMKAQREHRVPVSDGALAVLRVARGLSIDAGPNAPVFPGGRADKPLSNMAMLALLRRMAREDLTAHGFRSTFRDWAAEATNYPREVPEAALAHTISDKVEAAYRRGDLMDKRRQLMAEWSTFCTTSTFDAPRVVETNH